MDDLTIQLGLDDVLPGRVCVRVGSRASDLRYYVPEAPTSILAYAARGGVDLVADRVRSKIRGTWPLTVSYRKSDLYNVPICVEVDDA